jgi:hypothetical protein
VTTHNRKKQKRQYYLANVEYFKAKRRAYTIANKEKISENKKSYHIRNREKRALYNKNYKIKNAAILKQKRKIARLAADPLKIKAGIDRAHLFRRYGLTVEQYNDMSIKRNHVCAICKKSEASKRLAVDHCHNTGKIRALLCGSCNKLLGVFEKQKDKFAAYLQQYGAVS